MHKMLIFCSNPVNGGTAKVFTDLSIELQKKENNKNFQIVPCINLGNEVIAYKQIESLQQLDVISAEGFLGEKAVLTGLWKRIARRLYYDIRYKNRKEKNIHIMRQFIRTNKFDGIMIHNGGYIGDDLCNQFLFAARKERIPLRMMVFHNDFEKKAIQKLLCFSYDRKVSKWATNLITVSEFTRNRICSNSYITKKMEVIYNGLRVKNTLEQKEKREKLHLGENKFVIGMIGNFMEHKGHMYLLKAFRELMGKHKDELVLLIIGNVYEKDYFNKCIDFIKENNLEPYIIIRQGIYNAGEYAECFDVMAVPSLKDESFGLIAIEAMANKVPVVAFNCGGLPEVVKDQKDGFIIETGDFYAMSEALDKIIVDKNLRKLMGDNAKESFEQKFSLKKMTERYTEYVEKAYSGMRGKG